MADIIYVANLDDSQVLKALQGIDKSIDKVAGSADKNFQQVGKSASMSGLQIGAISGIVSSLVTEFINLGKQAVDVLTEIGKESVQTALEFDTLKARLAGIFKGNKEAAGEAFDFIQAKSKELGIDLGELAGAFIPKTENLAQFERVAKIATALARSDPEQGAIGARIALIEALSGTFTSLQRRFEIPKQDIDRLKEAFDTGGMEAFLTEFEKVLNESGKGFDDLSKTAQVSFNQIAITAQQTIGQIGVPIVAELQKAAGGILDFLNENETAIAVFADSVGDAVAALIQFFEQFLNLNEIKADDIINLGNQIYNFVTALTTASEFIARFAGTVGTLLSNLGQFVINVTGLGAAFEKVSPFIGQFFEHFSKGQGFAVGFLEFIAQSQAGLAGLAAILGELVKSAELAGEAFGALASGDFQKAIELNTRSNEVFNNSIEVGRKATQAAYAESKKGIEEYTNSVAKHTEEQSKLNDELERTKTQGTETADAISEAAAAERQASDAAEKLQEAQDKVNEALAKAEKDYQRKLEDIDIATERKRLDIAIEFAQKREDAAKKNLEKLADIERKYEQDVTDVETDRQRKSEDIARGYWRDRTDLEREQRQKLVDVETNYRQKLQDIQAQFLVDADEAENKRDAVAFLRAIKARDKAVQDAQKDRERTIQETQQTGEQKRQELLLQIQREAEDANIAEQRKLEDLKTNLERQIEEQNIAYARQLDDLAESEQRKNEELARSREQDIEDAKRAYDRKLEDLHAQLQAEFDLIAQNNAAIEEEQARHLAAMEELQAHHNQNLLHPGGAGSTTGTPTAPAGGTAGHNPMTVPQHFQHGGIVGAGRSVIVGEQGPELFTPNTAGRILPNNPLLMGAIGGQSVVSNNTYNNQRSASLGGLLDAKSLDTLLAAKVQNTLISLLGSM